MTLLPAAPPGLGDVTAPEKMNDSPRDALQSQGDLEKDQGVSSATVVPQEQRAANVISEKRSWVNVARKHVFTKQPFVSQEVDGKATVVVPKEVLDGAKPLWEDFLIGKFLSTKAPHVGKIHMIVNKIWRLGDTSTLIDVYEVNDTTVKFRVRNESMRRRILNRGMWNLMNIPMIVSKWSPFPHQCSRIRVFSFSQVLWVSQSGYIQKQRHARASTKHKS